MTELLQRGYRWVVDADLKSYFDTIPHERLMALVEEHIADGRVLALLRGYLRQGVMDGMKDWTPEDGTPQGAVISPLLANLYLKPLDYLLGVKGFELVRYADDFVILCRTREEADAALAIVQEWVTGAGLTLHPLKTRIVSEADGFDVLGYHFERDRHWPRQKSVDKFRDGIRQTDPPRQWTGIAFRRSLDCRNPLLRQVPKPGLWLERLRRPRQTAAHPRQESPL